MECVYDIVCKKSRDASQSETFLGGRFLSRRPLRYKQLFLRGRFAKRPFRNKQLSLGDVLLGDRS